MFENRSYIENDSNVATGISVSWILSWKKKTLKLFAAVPTFVGEWQIFMYQHFSAI